MPPSREGVNPCSPGFPDRHRRPGQPIWGSTPVHSVRRLGAGDRPLVDGHQDDGIHRCGYTCGYPALACRNQSETRWVHSIDAITGHMGSVVPKVGAGEVRQPARAGEPPTRRVRPDSDPPALPSTPTPTPTPTPTHHVLSLRVEGLSRLWLTSPLPLLHWQNTPAPHPCQTPPPWGPCRRPRPPSACHG